MSVIKSKPFYRSDWTPSRGKFAGSKNRYLLKPQSGSARSAGLLDLPFPVNKIRDSRGVTEVELIDGNYRVEAEKEFANDGYVMTKVRWGKYCIPSDTDADSKKDDAILLEKIDQELLAKFNCDPNAPIGIVDSGLCNDVLNLLHGKLQKFRNCQRAHRQQRTSMIRTDMVPRCSASSIRFCQKIPLLR